MPSLKSKNKGRDRQSRSRNTTPGSVVMPPVATAALGAGRIDIPISAMMIPTNVLYEDILERHSAGGSIPDPRHLDTLAGDLRTLTHLAEAREDACSATMRAISKPWKERVEEERDVALIEEKNGLKRIHDDDDEKSHRAKQKKRKDQKKEERPLTHGAHGVSRQDGVDGSEKAKSRSSPSHAKMDSGSSSSLSTPSQAQSPVAVAKAETEARAASPAASSSSEEERQPRPAASIPHFQTFGENPVEFDDPTVYHVREVTPDMTDEEKREIYNVAVFPKSDLADLIAGIPPDKDFSNAKPSNQVNANTFAAYLEPYFRPYTEEDIAFLKERGDRVTPFIMPRKGTKHWRQMWAEEDGAAPDSSTKGKYPPNQPRGSLEQMDDDVAETDQVSTGPMVSRLLSLMRNEQRPEAGDKVNGLTNGEGGAHANGDAGGGSGDGAGIGDALNNSASGESLPPPATALAGSDTAGWRNTAVPKVDYATADERIKQELRYIGFLGPDAEADYDAHEDDEVAQRLRVLQAELREVMVLNGARKARLLDSVEEHMGYQEYATIRDDLDTQVVAAYQKRTRTLGKGKKQAKRPGGAGGGSHAVAGGAGGAGMSRPGIGDSVRALLDRRRRWIETIGPIFSDEVSKVRGPGETIFDDETMKPYIVAERERLEEEEAAG